MSCLFDSMVVLLSRYGICFDNSQHLRNTIIKYMQNNPNLLIINDENSPIFDKSTCDKCNDLNHRTADCPWYKKQREDGKVNLTIKEWGTEVAKDMEQTIQKSKFVRWCNCVK